MWRARLDSGRGGFAALASGPPTTHLREPGRLRPLRSPRQAQASAWWVLRAAARRQAVPRFVPSTPPERLCLQTSSPPSPLPLFSPVA